MPNIKSAAKAMKTAAKHRALNRARKSEIRTDRQRFEAAVAAADAQAAHAAYRDYCSVLDKAAKTGKIKANCASRRKSRATLRLRRLPAAPQTA